MGRFSHISDAHLGAFNDGYLRKKNIESFIWALEKSKKENVDFVLITGDIFNSPLPEISQLAGAIKKMREIVDGGITIYTIYGSHDYSVTGSSLYNVLVAAGILRDVHVPREIDGKTFLDPVIDRKSGAIIYGMFARKMGIESYSYENLRISTFPGNGFRIFAFHSAVSEIMGDLQFKMAEIPMAYLPMGFNYYAGGHVHRRMEHFTESHGKIVYPGPIYASNFVDLERMAKGEERGFYIVDFSDKIDRIEFIRNPAESPEILEIDASGKTPSEVMNELDDSIQRLKLENRYLLVKIYGELSSGKTSDVDRKSISEKAKNRGAIGTYININSLTSREYPRITTGGRSVQDVEAEIISRWVNEYRGGEESLKGEKGVRMALSLFNVLKMQRNDDETREDFMERIREAVRKIIREDEWN